MTYLNSSRNSILEMVRVSTSVKPSAWRSQIGFDASDASNDFNLEGDGDGDGPW